MRRDTICVAFGGDKERRARRAVPLQEWGERRGQGQRVQKVPLSQLMRLPPLATNPVMIVPDQFVVS